MKMSNSNERLKRRRSKSKPDSTNTTYRNNISYATSWGVYIDGHVVSEVSRRLIVNSLAATAATQAEKQDDSSDDENEESWHNIDVRAGDLDIVNNTLAGIAKRSSDEGKQALGRHARTIRLGRSLWQSAPLTKAETENIRERHFHEGTFPPPKQLKKAVEAIKMLRKHAQLLSQVAQNHQLACL